MDMVLLLIVLQEHAKTNAYQIALLAGPQLSLVVMLVQLDLLLTLQQKNVKLHLVQLVIILQVTALAQLMDSYYQP